MRSSFAILICILVQVGCSSSYIVSSALHDENLAFSEFNAEAKDRSATIIFRDNAELYCQDIVAGSDSTSWLDPKTGVRRSEQTHTIKKIVFRNRILGALERGGLGLLVGGGGGALIGWAIEPPNAEWKGFIPLFFSLIGGGVGLIAGIIDGLVEGHTYEYEFEKTSEKPQSSFPRYQQRATAYNTPNHGVHTSVKAE